MKRKSVSMPVTLQLHIRSFTFLRVWSLSSDNELLSKLSDR